MAPAVDEESTVLFRLVRPSKLHVLLRTGLVSVPCRLQPLWLLDLLSSNEIGDVMELEAKLGTAEAC